MISVNRESFIQARWLSRRSRILLAGVLLLFSTCTAEPSVKLRAAKEEYLDPGRDEEISVQDDLRRAPHSYTDEQSGFSVQERDYLRFNHKTSEYARLYFRATQPPGNAYLDLKRFQPDNITCFPDKIIINCPSERITSELIIGRLIYGRGMDECACKTSHGNTTLPHESKYITRNVTGNYSEEVGEGGCINIVVPSEEVSYFQFFGPDTCFHFFSNYSQSRSQAEEIETENSGPEMRGTRKIRQSSNTGSEFSESSGRRSGTSLVNVPEVSIPRVYFGKANLRMDGCGVDFGLFEIDPCKMILNPLFSVFDIVIEFFEDIINDLTDYINQGLRELIGFINFALNELIDAITSLLEDAGLSPIWNGVLNPNLRFSLFNFNYNYMTRSPVEESISLVSTPNIEIKCQKCSATFDIGFGFDFMTQRLDPLSFNPSVPTSIEYMSMWTKGEANIEATFLTELELDDNKAALYMLLNSNPRFHTETEPFYKSGFYPRDHGVSGPRFDIILFGIVIPIELFMSLFFAMEVRTEHLKILLGFRAAETFEGGVAILTKTVNCDRMPAGMSRERCSRLKVEQCDGDNPSNVDWGDLCPYTFNKPIIDKWGPDIETTGIEIDLKIFPVFTLSVWEGVMQVHALLGSTLTTEAFFSATCSSSRRDLQHVAADEQQLLAPEAASSELEVISGHEDVYKSLKSFTPSSDDSQRRASLAFNLNFYITVDLEVWPEFNLAIPLAPFPGTIQISLDNSNLGTHEYFKNRELIAGFCVKLSGCGVATSGYQLIPTGLGVCNNDWDTEVFRTEALLPNGFDVYETKTTRVCCNGCRVNVQLIALCHASGFDSTMENLRALPAFTRTSEGERVREDFYAFSSILALTGYDKSGYGDTIKFSTDLWIPSNFPTIEHQQCVDGELRLLKRDAGGVWEDVEATVDCSGWDSRFAETVTFEVSHESVSSSIGSDTAEFVVAAIGKTRWGYGSCATRGTAVGYGTLCDDDATCSIIDPEGSTSCDCNPGFSGDGFHCFDLDECQLGTDTCNDVATCQNTPGSFECFCKTGYNDLMFQEKWTLQGADSFSVQWRAGNDLYMQLSNPDPHSEQMILSSYINGTEGPVDRVFWSRPGRQVTIFVSVTDTGFHIINSGKEVEWTYIPLQSPAGIGFTVTTVAGVANVISERASVESGYGAVSGAGCEEIDECALELHNCHVDAVCANTMGSFTCACTRGYTPADNQQPTPDDALTPNLPYGDGTLCYDEKECWFETDNCDPRAECENTFGSFLCIIPPGYTPSSIGDPSVPGDGSVLYNTNECLYGTDNCDAVATCTDTIGSFTCACPTGYTSAHSFEPGSPFGDASECFDDNECFFGTHNCDESATCTNTAGSFECNCVNGFYGEGTRGTCTTCTEDPELCNAFAECSTSDHRQGHYATCVCKTGFFGDGTSFGVKQPVWVDEADRGCMVEDGRVQDALGLPKQAVSTMSVTLALTKIELCRGMDWLKANKSHDLEGRLEKAVDDYLAYYESSGYALGLSTINGGHVTAAALDFGTDMCSGRKLAQELRSAVNAAGGKAQIMTRATLQAAISLFDTLKDPNGVANGTQPYDSDKVDPGEVVLAMDLLNFLYPDGPNHRDREEYGVFFSLFDVEPEDGSLNWQEFQEMMMFSLDTDYLQDSRRRLLSSSTGSSTASLKLELNLVFETENPFLNDMTLDAITAGLASYPDTLNLAPVASTLNSACDPAEFDQCSKHASCRSGTCVCPVGSVGTGSGGKYECKLNGYGVRLRTPLPTGIPTLPVDLNCYGSNDPLDDESCAKEVLADWELLVPTLLPIFGETGPWFFTSMHHRVETNADTGQKMLAVTGIFKDSKEAIDHAKFVDEKLFLEGTRTLALGITLSAASVNSGNGAEVLKFDLKRGTGECETYTPPVDQPYDNMVFLGKCDPERPIPGASQCSQCHTLAFCHSGDTCVCPVGSTFDTKYGCKLNGYGVRLRTPLPTGIPTLPVDLNCLAPGESNDPLDDESCAKEVLADWELLLPTLLPIFGETEPWFSTSLHHRVETNADTGQKMLAVTGIFKESKDASEHAKFVDEKLFLEGTRTLALGITLSAPKGKAGNGAEVLKFDLKRQSCDPDSLPVVQPFDNVYYIGECDPLRQDPNMVASDPIAAALSKGTSEQGLQAVMGSREEAKANSAELAAMRAETKTFVIVSIASITVAFVALGVAAYLSYYIVSSRKRDSERRVGKGVGFGELSYDTAGAFAKAADLRHSIAPQVLPTHVVVGQLEVDISNEAEEVAMDMSHESAEGGGRA